MDLRQLRYALAVVDHGSFTAAAAACFVAQPSLSQAVQRLERELGTALFERLGHRVALTAAGEAFVPAARNALRAVDVVRDEVRSVAGVMSGHLDLVALPTLASDPVAGLVSTFRRAHPDVVVRLAHPDSADDLVRSVRRGEAEIGITERPADTSGLVTVPFGVQEIVAVLPPGTPRPRRMSAARLADWPIVAQAEGASTRALLDATLAAAGVTARVAVETDQRELIVPLVLDGAGAALLPQPMAEQAARAGAVVARLDPPLVRELAVVHRRSPAPAARAFLALAAPRQVG